MMTVSAVARLMPWPPARVLSRKQKISDSGLLKLSIRICRSIAEVLPSSLTCGRSEPSRKSSNKSKTRVIWLKISTRCPAARSSGSILSSIMNLPEEVTSERWICLSNSSPLESKSGSALSKRYGWLQALRHSIATFISRRLALPFRPWFSSEKLRVSTHCRYERCS